MIGSCCQFANKSKQSKKIFLNYHVQGKLICIQNPEW